MKCLWCYKEFSDTALDIFEKPSCPYCNQPVDYTPKSEDYIDCTDCNTTYNGVTMKTCPLCDIQGRVKSEEILKFNTINDLTEEQIPKVVNGVMNALTNDGKYPAPLINFTSKYACYIHTIWQFVVDMQKGVIPNRRLSEAQKLEWAESHLDFFYAEGSRIEDVLDSPDISSEKSFLIDQSCKDRDDVSNGFRIYHNLENNSFALKALLKRFIELHRLINPMLVAYNMNIRQKASPLNKWGFIEAQAKKLIQQKAFDRVPS